MEEMNLQKKLLLLQVNDSLFPIGGYSHSYGLETYIQKDLVSDEKSAQSYIENRIRYSLSYTDLLAIRLAWEKAGKDDMEDLEELETKLEAARIPMEVREAARKLGSRFVKTVMQMPIEEPGAAESRSGEGESLPVGMEKFRMYAALRKGKTVSHPVAYGVFCSSIGIDIKETILTYLYGQVSAMVTNCVKSIPLSQLAGQRMLAAMGGLMEETLEKVIRCGEEMLCASTPGFDIRCMQHERLYSRLYMS